MKWYIIQARSGHEEKVAAGIKQHAVRHDEQHSFGEIIVPIENIVDMVGGKQKHAERKLFPGYILVQMDLNEATWIIVRNVPYVSNFLGTHNDNDKIDINSISTLTEQEVENIINKVKHSESDPTVKTFFTAGETIRINQGPFKDFNGTIEDVNYDRNILKVTVIIFGRATPVEIAIDQVEKI